MMPNGNYVLNDLELEEKMRDMSDRQLLEFNTRQSYATTILAHSNEKRIKGLENRSKKAFALSGGVGTLIGGVIIGMINYFTNKL